MLTFGEKIREARKAKGFTQKELAALVGAKHNSVSNWEKDQNRPDPDTIELLLGALDISPAYLFGKSDTKKSAPQNKEDAQRAEMSSLIASLSQEEAREVHDFLLYILYKRELQQKSGHQ